MDEFENVQLPHPHDPNEDQPNEEGEHGEVDVANAQRKRKYKSYNWVQADTFETPEAQEEFFRNEPCWKVEYKKKGVNGTRITYYCSHVSLTKGPRCPAQVQIQVLDNQVTNVLLRNGLEHVHDAEGQKLTRELVNQVTIDRIKYLLQLKQTTRIIANTLNNDQNIINKPTMNQVSPILPHISFVLIRVSL
jgi:hypothetical protein